MDSGFWLVGRFFGMEVPTTLKTSTVMQTPVGLAAFALASLILELFRKLGLVSRMKLSID